MHRSFRNYFAAMISSLFLLQTICQPLVIDPNGSRRLVKRMQPYKYAAGAAKISNENPIATSRYLQQMSDTQDRISHDTLEMDFNEIFEPSGSNSEWRSNEETNGFKSGVRYGAVELGGKASTQPYRHVTHDYTTSPYLRAMPSKNSGKSDSQPPLEMSFTETFEPSRPGQMKIISSGQETETSANQETRVKSGVQKSKAEAYFRGIWRKQY